MPDQIFRTPIKQLAPISDAKHLVTREYLEQKLAGAIWESVAVATTSGLAATATSVNILTASANGALPLIDGVTLTANQRVLVKDQADKTQNGIYVVTALGDAGTPYTLTRASDADEATEFKPAKTVYVLPGGAAGGNKTFKLTTTTAVTIGTSNIEFAPNDDTSFARMETVEITGDDTAKAFLVTHTLNTEQVTVACKNKTTKAFEDFAVEVVSATQVRISCDPALTTTEKFLVTITGQKAAV